MDDKQRKSVIRAIEKLLGNPLEAASDEVSALYAEFFEGEDPARSLYELASKSAQRYRLDAKEIPPHLADALASMKKAGESAEDADAKSIIEDVLRPMVGPSTQVSWAFHNRTARTEKDRKLLQKLSEELGQDWSEGRKE